LSYLARHLVRDLDPQVSKSWLRMRRRFCKDDLEFYRIRSKDHEIMVAACKLRDYGGQFGMSCFFLDPDFHLIVVQDPILAQEL